MKTELKLAVAAADFFKKQVDNFESLGIDMEDLLSYAYELETLFMVLMKTDRMADDDIEAILNHIDGCILIKCASEDVFKEQSRLGRKPNKRVIEFFKKNESWL